MTFQFRGPNGTDVRPVNVSGAKLWAKGPSAPGARDGTVWDPYLVNEIVGNLRGLLEAYEITGADSDDTRITQAVEAAASAAIAASLSGYAPLASPAFTGNPTAPTQSPGNNTTRLATTAFVKAAVDAAVATLGLGTAATQAYGTSANQLVRLDGTGKLPAVDGSQLTNLPSGGGSPGGSDGQVQYKSGSSFAAFAGVAIATSGDLLSLIAQAATDIPFAIKAHASQSAALTEWRNNAGTAKLYVKDITGSSNYVGDFRIAWPDRGVAIGWGAGEGTLCITNLAASALSNLTLQALTARGSVSASTYCAGPGAELGGAAWRGSDQTITLLNGAGIGWSSTSSFAGTADTFLRKRSAANIMLGASDAASPVAQTLSFQGGAAGQSNVAGASAKVDLSPSTGSALGGGLKFRGTNAGGAGSSQNSYSDWAEIVAGGGIKGYGTIESTTGGFKWPDGVTLSGVATAAQYRAKTANKVLSTDLVWAAVDMVALTDGATITPDFAAGINFTVTLGGSRTLANPSNLTPGQSGVIVVTQDATGSRTLAYGSQWKFPGGAPTLSTGANKIDVISYFVQSTSIIRAVLTKDYS